MNKHIIFLGAAVAFTMVPGSAYAFLHASGNEAQKAAVKEYLESNKEKHTAKAKQLVDLIIEIVPEFYLAEVMVVPHDDSLKMFTMICSTEIMLYACAVNHSELKSILEKYYDEATCKYAFDAGFNTLYSWEQFKIMYMYAIASISKDADFRKASLEAVKAELIPFADYLISLKNS